MALSNAEIVLIVIGLIGAFQFYVSIRLFFANAYSPRQKLAQLSVVWLVPALGAILVLSFLTADNAISRKRETAFTPDGGNNPPGIQ